MQVKKKYETKVTIYLPNGVRIDCKPDQVQKILKDADYLPSYPTIPQPQYPLWPNPYKLPDDTFRWPWDTIIC